MKKQSAISLCLMLALTLVLVGGCAAPVNQSPTVSLDIWHYYNGPQQDAFNLLVTEFNETVGAEKGIVVDASSQGNVSQLAQAVLDAANQTVGSRELPDVFAAYADTAYTLDRMGMVASLDNYLSAQELNTYLPSYIEEGRFALDGKIKIFPVAKSTELLLLNKTDWDLFAAATGASTDALATMEGVVETAREYYKWSDGKAMFGRDSMANYMLIGSMQLGQEIFQVQDGKMTLNLDVSAMQRLWENFYVPYINGWFTHFGPFRSDDIKTGDIIAMVGSTSGATYFPRQVIVGNNTAHDIQRLVLPAPICAGGETYSVQQGAGMVVVKSDKATETAAVEFLKWLTESGRSLSFALQSGYMPVTVADSSVDALRSYLKEHPDTNTSLADSMQVAFEVTQTHTMYTNKAFENGNAARNVLENSLFEQAAADRKLVDEQVAAGMSREKAMAPFLTQESFQRWYQSLCDQMQQALTK